MTAEAFALPFREALDYWQQKVDLPTARWDDMMRGAHARAFSVAGAQAPALLADLRSAIDAGQRGGTLAAFRKEFDQIVARHGWRYTGDESAARRAWRTKVMFETNIRTAYMAGRYRQLTDPDLVQRRPYWQYRHSESVRFPRPQHQAWHGLVLRWDDPWWKTHFPPNGWGCNCDVRALSPRDLRRLGKSGPDQAPADTPIMVTDPRTGQAEAQWPGIDRGWDYNVGEAWLQGAVPEPLQAPLIPAPPPTPGTPTPRSGPIVPPGAALPPLPPPRPGTAPRLPVGLSDQDYARTVLQRFGATLTQPAEFRDATGTVLTIGKDLFLAADGSWKANKNSRGPDLLRAADAILEPDEIWVDWASDAAGRVHLRRRYLRRWTAGADAYLSVFEWSNGGWWEATTLFPADRPKYLEQQRSGALLYRRP